MTPTIAAAGFVALMLALVALNFILDLSYARRLKLINTAGSQRLALVHCVGRTPDWRVMQAVVDVPLEQHIAELEAIRKGAPPDSWLAIYPKEAQAAWAEQQAVVARSKITVVN